MRLRNRPVKFDVGYRDWLQFHETFSESPIWKIGNLDRKFNRNLCTKDSFQFFQLILCIGLGIRLLPSNKLYSKAKCVGCLTNYHKSSLETNICDLFLFIYANTWARFKFQFDLIAHSGREREKKDSKLGLTEPMLTNGNIHRWNDQATDRPTDPYKHIRIFM